MNENNNGETNDNFDTNNIHSVELNLLDGQVDIILRSLELYGFNLDYMLNSSDSSDEAKQETMAMLKYTYEQILASRAEQVVSQSNNSHLSAFGEILSNHAFKREENKNIEKNKNFRVV